MEYRTCTKCNIEKPLTLEYFKASHKSKSKFNTACRVCMKKYMAKWQENKRLSRDPEEKRLREMYKIKEITEEEKREKIRKAYSYIYYEAFGRAISEKQLKDLEGIEE